MKMRYVLEDSSQKNFLKYYSYVEWQYKQSHENEKVTQKNILAYYNEKFGPPPLSESSLSKYLSGRNEIPVGVYVRMKELAGVEEFFAGAGASREEYDIASEINESIEFVMDEVFNICENTKIKELGGKHVAKMIEQMMLYFEFAQNGDTEMCIDKLHYFERELENVSAVLHGKLQKSQNAFGDTDKTVIFENYHNDCWHDTWKGSRSNGVDNNGDLSINLSDFVRLLSAIRRVSDTTLGCLEGIDKIRPENLVDIPLYYSENIHNKYKGLVEPNAPY